MCRHYHYACPACDYSNPSTLRCPTAQHLNSSCPPSPCGATQLPGDAPPQGCDGCGSPTTPLRPSQTFPNYPSPASGPGRTGGKDGPTRAAGGFGGMRGLHLPPVQPFPTLQTNGGRSPLAAAGMERKSAGPATYSSLPFRPPPFCLPAQMSSKVGPGMNMPFCEPAFWQNPGERLPDNGAALEGYRKERARRLGGSGSRGEDQTGGEACANGLGPGDEARAEAAWQVLREELMRQV